MLTVLIRHRIYGSAIRHGEDLVMEQLHADVAAEQERIRGEVGTGLDSDCVIETGDDAMSALRRYEWQGDELLVLASAKGGVVRRVFLGDMTYKLVRATHGARAGPAPPHLTDRDPRRPPWQAAPTA